MSAKTPLLNVVHVWLPMKHEEMTVKKYTEYQYISKGILQYATTINPVYRYAKNFTKDDVIFSLCLITLDGDQKAVEQFLDLAATQIDTNQYAGRIFAKTEIEYNA